jgi:hypothetical protein
MDVGPLVALAAVAFGAPYMAWRRQWLLAGFCLATAASIVCRAFLRAPAAGEAFSWLSIALLGIGAFQLVRKLRSESRSAG